MKPQRIQLSRRKGFRLQDVSRALNGLDAVKCARPANWGNPFKVGEDAKDAAEAVRMHTEHVERQRKHAPKAFARAIQELRGKNLACYCALGAPCHVDTLLRIANE